MKTITTLLLITWPVFWSAAQTSLPDVDVKTAGQLDNWAVGQLDK